MKAMLMSIQPQWIAKILNGEKTIEIRRKFPKDYVGWVYIYVTKNKFKLFFDKLVKKFICTLKHEEYEEELNGKVVARFYCDKVEEIYCNYDNTNCYVYFTDRNDRVKSANELLEKGCIHRTILRHYLKEHDYNEKCGYAIHISQLEIFDRPKELSEFKHNHKFSNGIEKFVLRRPPQNYLWIEVEE